MATITGLTAERMQEIIDATIVDADVIADHLILTRDDGSTIDAGDVRGPAGATGEGVVRGAAFPGSPTDGLLAVRTDQAGDPLYKYSDGLWIPMEYHTPESAILGRAPSSFWKLEEPTGNYADSGSGGITATAGVSAFSRAVRGYRSSRAVGVGTFDTALATFGDNYRFINRAPFSVLVIHKPTDVSTTARRIITKCPGDSSSGWALLYNSPNGNVIFQRSATNVIISTALPTLNDWNLIVATYDGNNAGIYVNGIFAQAADVLNIVGTADVGRINGLPGDVAGRGAYGQFDCVAIWNRALSQAELDLIWKSF